MPKLPKIKKLHPYPKKSNVEYNSIHLHFNFHRFFIYRRYNFKHFRHFEFQAFLMR